MSSKLVWILLMIFLVVVLFNDAESKELKQRSEIRKKSTKKYDQLEMSIFPHQPQYITNYNTVIIDSFAIESFIVPQVNEERKKKVKFDHFMKQMIFNNTSHEAKRKTETQKKGSNILIEIMTYYIIWFILMIQFLNLNLGAIVVLILSTLLIRNNNE